MKSKLAASFYLYLAGTCWRDTRSTMASRSMLTFLSCRHCQISCSSQAKGFESSSRAAHYSAEPENDVFSDLGPKKLNLVTEKAYDFVDDDFSELGPGISECSTKKIKLATEKPDHFGKARPSRKKSPRKPLSSDNMLSVNNLLSAANAKASTKPGGNGHSPTSIDDNRKVSDIESPAPLSVSIKNVSSTVGLTELVEAISIYGKVSGASFVTSSKRLRCCNVEFEDVESSRKAIMAGEVKVGSQVFPVDRDAVDLVTIRIKNISDKTSDYEVHTRCKSVGELVGLIRTSKDCAEAFFNVPNHSTPLDIVKKLNDLTVDLNRWSAKRKSKSSEVALAEEDGYKLGLQIFDRISKLKQQVDMKRVHLEDLEYLNASMMHMKESFR